MKIDKKDEAILSYLKENAREHTKKISRKLGIPRVTVHERIKKLKASGVIKKFTIAQDYSKLGMPVTVFILLSYEPSKGASQRELAGKIAKIPQVFEVHLLAGEEDMLLKVRGASLEEIGKLVIDKLREFKGVGKTKTIACFATEKEEN